MREQKGGLGREEKVREEWTERGEKRKQGRGEKEGQV